MELDDTIRFDDKGLIAAVVQDAQRGQVLMLGYMNRESLLRTLKENRVWFWSRSRQKFWMKGETSGNVLEVQEIRVDCDGDALLLKCRPAGPTCHTGETSCFYRTIQPDGTMRHAPEGLTAAS